MNKDYNFNVEEVYLSLVKQWHDFMDSHGMTKIVLGISGGKDSTVCAYIAAKEFGPENVYGVMMPCDEQADINDSEEVIKLTGIHRIRLNIGDAFHSIIDGIENNCIDISNDTRINLPPRLRMSVLYGVAQSVGGCVLNTDNKCELIAGYYSLYGDGAGSYGPIRDLTVPEVIELGKYLNIPEYLIMKKPGDGLQALGDEERIGFTYSDMHNFIRNNIGSPEFKKTVYWRYLKNKFKTDMVNIKSPVFDFPNYVESFQID